jgi:hypothetical protein
LSLSEAAKKWISREIARELKKLTKLPCKIEAEYEPDWGYIYYVTIDANAREALDINLRLQEKFKGIPIVFEWTGETDVSEEELAEKLAEILLKGGIKAKLAPGFSAVKAVEGNRED